MSDQELLELAARAIGGEYSWGNKFDGSMTGYLEVGDDVEYWNPLENDGDAFRLMVRLRLTIHCFRSSTCVAGYGGLEIEEDGIYEQPARRAIVRAAAAIGSEI